MRSLDVLRSPRRLRAWLSWGAPGQRLPLIRAALGALLGILLTGVFSEVVAAPAMMRLLLIAPMGAAAVLLFAAPTSPLAQPWPVLGGNCLSALIGVLCLEGIGYSLTGAAVAVGAAIAAMTALRCLHPPGGAAALSAVLGGPMLGDHAYGFVGEVALNAALLLAAAYLYNNLTGRPYPHRPEPAGPEPTAMPVAVEPADVQAALRHLGPTIGRGDLERLPGLAAAYACARCAGSVTCREVASRPPAVARSDMELREVRKMMRAARVATLPVVDEHHRLRGVVTRSGLARGSSAGPAWLGSLLPLPLCDLLRRRRAVAGIVEATPAASVSTRLGDVAPYLLDGGRSWVPVVDEAGRLAGLVTRGHLIEACRARQPA